jgi:hypothetical protein
MTDSTINLHEFANSFYIKQVKQQKKENVEYHYMDMEYAYKHMLDWQLSGKANIVDFTNRFGRELKVIDNFKFPEKFGRFVSGYYLIPKIFLSDTCIKIKKQYPLDKDFDKQDEIMQNFVYMLDLEAIKENMQNYEIQHNIAKKQHNSKHK